MSKRVSTLAMEGASLGILADIKTSWWKFTASTTWVCPFDGFMRMHLLGGGGGGNYSSAYRTSGGSSGYVRKVLEVTKGMTFNITVGAGGSGTSAANVPAGAGTSSQLTIDELPDISLIAGGGYGGLASSVGGTQGGGGFALGGDINRSGNSGRYYDNLPYTLSGGGHPPVLSNHNTYPNLFGIPDEHGGLQATYWDGMWLYRFMDAFGFDFASHGTVGLDTHYADYPAFLGARGNGKIRYAGFGGGGNGGPLSSSYANGGDGVVFIEKLHRSEL